MITLQLEGIIYKRIYKHVIIPNAIKFRLVLLLFRYDPPGVTLFSLPSFLLASVTMLFLLFIVRPCRPRFSNASLLFRSSRSRWQLLYQFRKINIRIWHRNTLNRKFPVWCFATIRWTIITTKPIVYTRKLVMANLTFPQWHLATSGE